MEHSIIGQILLKLQMLPEDENNWQFLMKLQMLPEDESSSED